jgi:hypothetical protein
VGSPETGKFETLLTGVSGRSRWNVTPKPGLRSIFQCEQNLLFSRAGLRSIFQCEQNLLFSRAVDKQIASEIDLAERNGLMVPTLLCFVGLSDLRQARSLDPDATVEPLVVAVEVGEATSP